MVVSYISRLVTTLKAKHWVATKWVVRYVKGTLNFGILYSRSKDPRLLDWAGFIDDKKSIFGYAFNLATSAIT